MALVFSFISGFMIGIEFLWDTKILVLDVGIIRVFIGTKGNMFEEEENKE